MELFLFLWHRRSISYSFPSESEQSAHPLRAELAEKSHTASEIMCGDRHGPWLRQELGM